MLNVLNCVCLYTGLRNIHGICPPEVLRFLLDLFKYNDNSKNHFSDNYYKAALVDALAATITPVISVLQPVSTILDLWFANFLLSPDIAGLDLFCIIKFSNYTEKILRIVLSDTNSLSVGFAIWLYMHFRAKIVSLLLPSKISATEGTTYSF